LLSSQPVLVAPLKVMLLALVSAPSSQVLMAGRVFGTRPLPGETVRLRLVPAVFITRLVQVTTPAWALVAAVPMSKLVVPPSKPLQLTATVMICRAPRPVVEGLPYRSTVLTTGAGVIMAPIRTEGGGSVDQVRPATVAAVTVTVEPAPPALVLELPAASDTFR